MFKKKSKNEQHRASHLSIKDLSCIPENIEQLDKEEQRAILSRLCQFKDAEIANHNKKKFKQGKEKWQATRKRLGLEKQAIQNRINEIRPARKSSPEIVDFYIEAVKELYGEYQHQRIMKKAVEMWEESKGK